MATRPRTAKAGDGIFIARMRASAVVTVLAMFGHQLGWMAMGTQSWLELVLTVPIVLWAGWPFFERGWRSLATRRLNMFTLIALGTGAAFLYSIVAVLAPGLFRLTDSGD